MNDLRLPRICGPGLTGRPTRRSPRLLGAVVLLAVSMAACGSSTDLEVLRLTVSPESGLVVGVGGTNRFLVTALGAQGRRIDASGAVWESADPTVATVDGRGVTTGVAEGDTELTVRLGGLSATVGVEFFNDTATTEYLPGVSYFGRREYVEYIPGRLPVVLSAPHGGDRMPSEIPRRTVGVIVGDSRTVELTLAAREELLELTGFAPHVVLSHLDRSRLDPNREIVEAAQENHFAERAWEEYHGFIETARESVAGTGGGMYFDMHGHSHPADRLELGYLLSADRLSGTDESLNSLAVVQLTSIREIGRNSPLPFSQLLRGPTSFGGLLEEGGVDAVPSPSMPSPGDDPYFSGGYSTRRHGSMEDTELVSGIQIEHHYPGLRDSDANRRAYAATLAEAIRDFTLEHFGYFEP